MNEARFAVGMQGVSIAERAYQKAARYAQERVQSRAVQGSSGPVPIVEHPDGTLELIPWGGMEPPVEVGEKTPQLSKELAACVS